MHPPVMRLTPSCSSLDGLLTHIQHHVLGATTRGATLERVVVQRLPHITLSTAPWPSHHPFTSGDRYTVCFTLQQPSAMLHDVRAAPSSFPSSYLSALQRGLPKHTIRATGEVQAAAIDAVIVDTICTIISAIFIPATLTSYSYRHLHCTCPSA